MKASLCAFKNSSKLAKNVAKTGMFVKKLPFAPADSQRSPVLSVSQEWFPILDKVFGQKWCSDVLQIKELAVEGGGRGEERAEPPITSSVTLEPAPSSPQQDPRWTPLEDMEVFSPDQITLDDTADSLRNLSGPSHGPALSPTTNLSQAAEAQLPGEGKFCTKVFNLTLFTTIEPGFLKTSFCDLTCGP